MDNTVKTFIWTFLLLFVPFFANAEWYWLSIPENPEIGEFVELSAVEYAITPIPKDQIHALPETFFETLNLIKESDACFKEYDIATEKLRKFDTENILYDQECTNNELKGYQNCSRDINQETVDARNLLIVNIERKFEQCIQNEREAIIEQQRKEAEQSRLNEILSAIEDCNFDYFENEMTDEERMGTWSERQKCADKEIVSEEREAISMGMEIVPDIQTQDIPIGVPGSPTVPVKFNNTESVSHGQETNGIAKIDEVVVTDMISSNKESLVKDSDVEHSDSEQQFIQHEVIEQEEKLSIFKRISNFFVRIFSW